MTTTILVVDDDAHIREVLRYALEKEGFAVHEAANGRDGLRQALSLKPTLIVLDIMMPEMDGLTMCREFRQASETPILFLSSRDEEIDRIIGLEMGGDDYVSKPFSPRELVARVKVTLKRLKPAEASASDATCLIRGGLQLDHQTYQVLWQTAPIALTATEFQLLQTFMQHPNKVYTRDELVQADIFKDIVSDRTIDSHIRRLRKKLSDAGCRNGVETVHGFGYKLGPCQT
jgi:two-component system OmpR family response regulator